MDVAGASQESHSSPVRSSGESEHLVEHLEEPGGVVVVG